MRAPGARALRENPDLHGWSGRPGPHPEGAKKAKFMKL